MTRSIDRRPGNRSGGRRSASGADAGAAGDGRFERLEPIDGSVAVGLGRLVAGAVCPVASGEELEQRMGLIERDELGLARRANQLLAGERSVADECLERRLGARPEIDDVGGEIFGRPGFIEVSQYGSGAVQRGDERPGCSADSSQDAQKPSIRATTNEALCILLRFWCVLEAIGIAHLVDDFLPCPFKCVAIVELDAV